MAKTVTYNLQGLIALKNQMPEFTNDIIKGIAKRVPNKIIASIKKGYSGIDDRTPLPINSRETLNRKIREGKPAKSLIDEGDLTDPDYWRFSKVGKGYKVENYTDRAVIMGYLSEPVGSRPAYNVMKVPNPMPKWITSYIRNQTTKFLKKYV
jgi:hypothetical protein